ncbi:MAG: hypothetical protein G01um101425_153 [Candidatus Peregrinibacteria bacterium Gr01-1014_25]|nr:MAG: hypothetical protein G01um101425_153 [Candidatus Peregrinibacteria bacterium Gr01-1014_25]
MTLERANSYSTSFSYIVFLPHRQCHCSFFATGETPQFHDRTIRHGIDGRERNRPQTSVQSDLLALHRHEPPRAVPRLHDHRLQNRLQLLATFGRLPAPQAKIPLKIIKNALSRGNAALRRPPTMLAAMLVHRCPFIERRLPTGKTIHAPASRAMAEASSRTPYRAYPSRSRRCASAGPPLSTIAPRTITWTRSGRRCSRIRA